MGNAVANFFPPSPKFTDDNVPDQSGKVFIVTGASTGVGLALARILYSRHAKVYIAARSPTRIAAAITTIQSAVPTSRGSLETLIVDLSDLASVQRAAAAFLEKESRLDVLWNNAAVMAPPAGSISAQGYELQLGVNTIAAFLFTKLLVPVMARTAASQAEKDTVRVVWVSSSSAEILAPKGGGVPMDNLDYKKGNISSAVKYGISKAGMILLAQEFKRRFPNEGIVSVALNPGNLKTELSRHVPRVVRGVFNLVTHDPVFGAYTELYAGFSTDITVKKSGCWVAPWGRLTELRKDIHDAQVPASEGGSGLGSSFWDWCEKQVENYAAI